MTKFEDQLYADLIRQHGSALAGARPPAAARRHVTARRALLAAGAGGLAVAATATVTALASGGATPAYALTDNHDGTVTLAVYQTAGIAQANAKLRQLGDSDVVVVPVRPGCPSLGSLPAPAVPPKGKISVRGTASSGGSITVHAQGVPAGDIIVVGVETTAQGTQAGSALTSDPAPSCVSLPARPPGNGGPRPVSGHRSGGSGGVPGSNAARGGPRESVSRNG